MTLAAAKAKGYAEPVSGRANNWKSWCPTCNHYSAEVPTKGEASFQARAHNAEFHGGAK